VLLKVATPAPTCAICVNAVQPDPVQRSILKPVSFVALSCHVRLIWDAETVLAVSDVGAAGTVTVGDVDADATLE
jgi:hypothetical protein